MNVAAHDPVFPRKERLIKAREGRVLDHSTEHLAIIQALVRQIAEQRDKYRQMLQEAGNDPRRAASALHLLDPGSSDAGPPTPKVFFLYFLATHTRFKCCFSM